jgi:hypothetical protein
MLDSTTKHGHSIDVAIPNSHNLHSAITERLQKCTDLKEELTSMWQIKTVYIILLVLSTRGIIPNRLHDSLKLLNVRPAVCILTKKIVIMNTCRIVRKFSAEQ